MTNYYWNNCYRWSNSSWEKWNRLPQDTRRALTESGTKQDWLLKYEKQLGRQDPNLRQPPEFLQIDCEAEKSIYSDVDAVGNSDSPHWLNKTPFPWEKWEQLPKEERDAEMKEALKNNNQAEVWRQQIINRGGDPDDPNLNPESRRILSVVSDEGEGDALTGETAVVEAISKADVTPIDRFPFWDVAGTAADTEAVGHPGGLFPLPDLTDQLANNEAQQNDRADSLTGHALTNAETTDVDWIQMHHDDGIQDGYLDETQSDSITGETTTTKNVGRMSGRVTFTRGTGTSQSWYNGQLVTGDISVSSTNNNWASENNIDITSKPETFSPVEFNVTTPLMTDQAVVGDQLQAVGANGTCRQVGDPHTGVFKMVCEQYIG